VSGVETAFSPDECVGQALMHCFELAKLAQQEKDRRRNLIAERAGDHIGIEIAVVLLAGVS
jgi:hypothetical protein